MYESYYGFSEKPFSILPDPEFLYWSTAHRRAFSMLEYGILNHAGFTIITGDIGSGKTTLVRHLLKKLEADITAGILSNTRQDSFELIKWILMVFNLPIQDTSYVANYQTLSNFMHEQYAQGKKVLLVIDEAQNLGVEAIEELRMLSNINTDKNQIFQLIMTGQPQLRELVRSPALKQFAQRIASDFHLASLNHEDGINYIGHRLAQAGGNKYLFTEEACQLIIEASQGIPRVINILCDTSLIYGLAIEADEITANIAQHVLEDKAKFGIFSVNESENISVLEEHRRKMA